MTMIDETRATYGRAWLAQDAEERRRLLAECFAAEGLFVDPSGPVVARGRDALFDHITSLWEGARTPNAEDQTSPRIKVEAEGDVEENLDGWFRFRFRWCLPTGQTLLRGTDFGHVDSDGRFELIVVFLDPTEQD
jgi:hypothetical protein